MGLIKAGDALLNQLKACGMNVIFGNPGSTEENFLEAVNEHSDIKYVLGLQEACVAAMADGWARTTRKPAVCQVHSAVGLGNAMGVLYEAFRSHTPMIVFAGEPPLELQAFDGFLAGDLSGIAMPLTKWSARITHGRQLLRMLRRAIKVASTPPLGPVFLSLPMDVLDQEIIDEGAYPQCQNISPGVCSFEIAQRIADKLISAESPIIIAGDGVAESDARDELHELSDILACPVWGMEFNCLSLSFRDPMFMGLLGHSFGSHTRTITNSADLVLGIGTPLFAELFPSVEPYFTKDAILMQIDRDSWEIGKNFPLYAGVQADPKESLKLVINAVRERIKPHIKSIEIRRRKVTAQKKAAFEEERRNLEAVPDTENFMSAATLMRTLVEELPEDVLIYDESLTSTAALIHYLQPDKMGSYILARGGCIGVGWPGAIGAAIAHNGRRVIAPSGDGSALFALQSLWTAVNERLKIIFIVCNNSAYRILKINLLHYLKDTGGKPGSFPFMDINSPSVNFAALAEGFGMYSVRVKNAESLRIALRDALKRDGPVLIDAAINGSVEQEIHQLFPDGK